MSQSFAEVLSWVPKSRGLAAALARAHDFAKSRSHHTVTLEHLLLALTSDNDAAAVLQACAVDLDRLNSDAASYLTGNEERLAGDSSAEPAASPELVRIIEYATAAARQSRRREVNGAIVLAAIVGDGRSPAAGMLRAQGLTFEEAIKALQKANAASRGPQGPQPRPAAPVSQGAEPAPPRAAPSSPAAPPSEPSPVSSAPTPPADPQAREGSSLAGRAPEQSTEEILAAARRRLGIGLNGARPENEDRPVGQHSEVAPPSPQPHHAPEPEPAGYRRPPGGQTSAPSHSAAAPGLVSDEQPSSPAPEDAPAAKYPPSTPPMPQARPQPTDWHLPNSEREAAEVAIRPRAGAGPSAPQPGGYHHPQPVRGAEQPAQPPRAAPPRIHPHPAQNRPVHGHAPHPSSPTPPPPPRYPEPPRPADARWSEPPPMPGPPQSGRMEPQAAPPPRPSLDARRRGGESETSSAPLSPGQLVENIPRRMTVGVTELVEVAIARAEITALAEKLQGSGAAYRHEVIVTKAMSVRLRAPEGGFWIETASPETQWIENTLGLLSDDYASWRWAVTPQQRGKARLQLIVSARTVGADGLAAETALPDQVIEVKVRTNYQRTAMQWAGWLAAAMVGGILARFGEGLWEIGGAVLTQLGII